MSSQSQAHLTLYNEERKQEGDFWYHLFFCDSNKAAVSQLGKYTVIIVYYSNCIMQKQMIFFPEKKNLFSLWLCFLPPQKYRIRNFHLKSEGFPCPWPVEAAWSQLSRRMPVSTSVSDANCAPRPAHFTTLPSSLSVSLAWLCLPPWAPTMWNTPLLDQCSSVCERIWELGEKGSPWDNPRAEPVGRRKENHVPLFAENNFASAQHYLNLWGDCFSPIFDIAYENVKAKKKKRSFLLPSLWCKALCFSISDYFNIPNIPLFASVFRSHASGRFLNHGNRYKKPSLISHTSDYYNFCKRQKNCYFSGLSKETGHTWNVCVCGGVVVKSSQGLPLPVHCPDI